jgi:GT2 family glycosyltransferase
MDLSISIVNWNTRDLLEHCLASICENVTKIEYEVIVVDNASQDGSAEMVRQRFPQVILLENNENLGFARANNQAMERGVGDYLLLLNSDTLVLSGALEKMLDFMQAHPNVGAMSCKLLDEKGVADHFPKTFPTLYSEASRLLWLSGLCDRVTQYGFLDRYRVGEVDRIKGACMLVRRGVVESVGLMEEQLFMFAEEDDWCFRIRKQGWKVYYLPDAEIIHYQGASVKQASQEMFLQLHKGKVAFFRKHYGPFSTALLKVVYLAGYSLRLGVVSLIGLASRRSADKARTKRRHYTKLLQGLPSW